MRPACGIPEEVRLPVTIASAFLLAVSLLVLVIAATTSAPSRWRATRRVVAKSAYASRSELDRADR